MKAVIIFFTIAVSVKSEVWKISGNPLFSVRPCNDTNDIYISYELGKPPEDENEYVLYIVKNLPKNSRVLMKFDSEASVKLLDKSYARVYTDDDGYFEIRFFKAHDGLSLRVKGPSHTPVVPYLVNLEINSAQYCPNPRVGYLDQYIEGYKDYAETRKKVQDLSCGRRKISYAELIVNGASTQPGDYPWHVALYRLDKNEIRYICGGTLVSKIFVLTAAHCVTVHGATLLPEKLSVVLGKYNLIGGDPESQVKEVHSIIVHEDFSTKYLDNDIALLKLSTEVQFNDYIQPACLWRPEAYTKLPTNRVFGTVVGWGFDNTDHLSNQLKMAKMPKVPESTCLKKNPVFYGSVLNDRKFCAGFNNGKSACNGDSGGGFVVFVPDTPKDSSANAAGSWYIRGIVSLSAKRNDLPICDPYQYVVFTDVAKYVDWLKRHT